MRKRALVVGDCRGAAGVNGGYGVANMMWCVRTRPSGGDAGGHNLMVNNMIFLSPADRHRRSSSPMGRRGPQRQGGTLSQLTSHSATITGRTLLRPLQYRVSNAGDGSGGRVVTLCSTCHELSEPWSPPSPACRRG